MNTERATQFFSGIKQSTVRRYSEYWETIRPKTLEDYFRRYLFAITSVHTSWAGNVRGFNAIKDLGWLEDKNNLRERLIFARCGMFNGRTETIWKFKSEFFANPERYCSVPTDWKSHRNALVNDIKGLGVAKVSFTLEMIRPNEAEVTCIDTHGIQLYELQMQDFKSKKGLALYEEVEDHWLGCSKALDCSPTVARAIYWDKKQKRRNSRYWTYVLEN